MVSIGGCFINIDDMMLFAPQAGEGIIRSPLSFSKCPLWMLA